MKILIVSDTHRQNGNLCRVLEKVKPIDMMIHCGDIEGGEALISEQAGCRTEMVTGNNDFFSELEKEREFNIGKYKVWLTHGHYYCVSMGIEYIKKEAEAKGVDIVMFGHTHKPILDIKGSVTAINPGSLSYPRQENRRPSYIIMELDEKSELHYTINYLS